MKTFFTAFLLLVTLGLSAQSYNNEWIDYSKTYYKFKVPATGLYRITRAVLASVNMGLENVPVQQFQLYRNGQEVPIYSSNASGALSTSDYIEFWGRMNDGAPDQALYRSPTYQHTQKWSLETDTATYFLTVNTTGTPFHYANAINDTTGTPLTVEPYFMHKQGTYFHSGINPGFAQLVGELIYSSSYDLGEFWSSGLIGAGSSLTDNQSNLFPYTSGPDATVSFGMTGCADYNRNVRFVLNGAVMIDTPMNSFYDVNTTKAVPIGLLSSGNVNAQYMNNSAVSVDRMVASYYELNYPRQFNFGGQPNFYFELPAKSNGYFLKINNLAMVSGVTPVLYDMTSGQRYTAIVGPGSTLSFLLTGSSFTRRLVLVNEDPSLIRTVASLTPRTFTNFALTGNQGNYIIVSHPALYTGTSGNNPVVDYRNYRSSPAGGSFNAHIYDIDELVDQFGFGIKKNPISVHNFMRYARANFASQPQFVLLIGHGLDYTAYFRYSEILHDPMADRLNLVPTFGYPASDNKLSASNVLEAAPTTPIGRISAVNGAEVENYLIKLKEYEQVQATAPNTIDGRLWMKNVLHLTGVSEPFLGEILCNYMYQYKEVISDTSFGANVSVLCDGSAGQITQVPLNLISNLFKTGLSILTYFGHSSNVTLGYNLDDPKDYDNQGKYPVFFINGCDAGDFFVYDGQRFGSSMTLSERYVLSSKDHGAVAFVASTHFGIVNYLQILLSGLYYLIDEQDYGKPLGVIQKDALNYLVSNSPDEYYARLHAEEMTTHGDPALRLNQGSLPDYDVEASQVKTTPTFVSIADTAFAINARFYNLGKSVSDSITVVVSQKYPNGNTVVLLRKRIKGIIYSDSVSLSVPIVAARDKGQNFITVAINTDNDVIETTLSNNSVTVGVYIYEDEANPVYPYNYGIINTSTQKLYASTSNPFANMKQYAFQVDTTELFNSNIKVSGTVSSTGGLLEFDPHITYLDTTVYYWRVAIVPSRPDSPYLWNTASFVYINPATGANGGYNQSHYYQHIESTLDSLYMDVDRVWKPTVVHDNIYVRNTTFPTGSGSQLSYTVSLNGNPYIGPGCQANELIINIIDPITFKPWVNDYSGPTGLYGSSKAVCGSQREWNFDFSYNNAVNRKKAMDFLTNIVPDGYYVVIRNNDDPNFANNVFIDQWKADTALYGSNNSLYHVLYNAGLTLIDSFVVPRAYGAVYQKGNHAFVPKQQITKDIYDAVALSVDCQSMALHHTVTSPQFGPAKAWKKLIWRGSSVETPTADVVGVDVYGIDTTGASVLIYPNLGLANQDFDISGIDAKKYPYVRLKMNASDTVKGTPYQLRYWRVTDDPVPEGALAPNIFLTGKDTLALGETLKFGIAFKNVSPTAFDSMTIKLNIIDKSNFTHSLTLPRKKPLISGDTLMLTYDIDTKPYAGANTLYLDVNPNNAQPEQFHFNNFLYKTFYVGGDGRAPVLDVTFDNIHILNDDIVSAKPHIQIKLKSPSNFLLLTDTSLLTMQLQYPDGTMHSIGFNNDSVRFTPATTGGDNTATVDITPSFTKQYKVSGDDYTLIVTGKDAIGNTAGTVPYRVTFKVINKPMISNLLNYPNPFTTSTAFVFTITGSEVPNIKIQILTITGKIVKEITKEELGPLHIGRNITEYKWNGTDEYGQRLANGVYLYHVVTNLNGHSMDKYKAAGDNTDKYFNNGYGKMYLMK